MLDPVLAALHVATINLLTATTTSTLDLDSLGRAPPARC